MTYTFQSDIKKSEYQKFIKNANLVSFMNEASWAQIKNNWKSHLVGLYREKELIAVSLLLIRNITKGVSFGYVPRGYVIDYSDLEALKEFTYGIKNLARQEHCYVVKIDPNFCFHENSILELKKKESVSIPLVYSKNHETYHNNLLSLHYKHKGFPKEITKTLQPRYHMMVPLIHEDFTPVTEEEFMRSLKRKIRDQLGNFHKKRGVFFEHTTDKKYLDDFIHILHSTEKRQSIHLRNKEYFEKIMDSYKENAVLFFGKIDLTVYLDFLKNNNGKETDIEMVTKLLSEGEKVVTVSTALVIMPSNQKIRTSEYLYAGNQLLASKLQVSLGLVFDICNYSIRHNCSYCNLGGVDGNLNDHLSTFKSKFNPIVMEFSGEYDLPIKKYLYYPIEFFLPLFKRMHLK